jgi:hypothetical protein
MATEAARLERKESRKKKRKAETHLTHTGLLTEGTDAYREFRHAD